MLATAGTTDHELAPVEWAVVIGASLAAAVIDIRSRRIPNWLTGPVLAAGLIWAGVWSGLGGLGDALGGCVIMAIPYVLLFVFAGGGAGDAKLMGALGVWLGVKSGATVLLAVALSGIVLAGGYALVRRHLRSTFVHVKAIAFAGLLLTSRQGSLSDSQQLLPAKKEMLTMPYGLAIFVGVCLAAGVHFLWPL